MLNIKIDVNAEGWTMHIVIDDEVEHTITGHLRGYGGDVEGLEALEDYPDLYAAVDDLTTGLLLVSEELSSFKDDEEESA